MLFGLESKKWDEIKGGLKEPKITIKPTNKIVIIIMIIKNIKNDGLEAQTKKIV